MKKTIRFSFYSLLLFCFVSCQDAAKKETTEVATSAGEAKPAVAETPKADLAQIRSEIVAIETAWAAALNAKDINALMAMYTEDAQSMQDGAPTLSGKSAIQQQQEKDFAKPAMYASIAFETTDVYAQGDFATEIGKSVYKDATGKITGTGKYVAVFQKKDGKYLCVREIYNKDSK